MPAQEVFERVHWMIDTLFPSPVLIIILVIPLAIAIGLRLAAYLTSHIQAMVMNMPPESPDKPKREPPVSFFEHPDTEPDYVVGFGDDGELVYASEKPKRKNDEVDE